MIAEYDIRDAVMLALRNDAALVGAINGVYDGVPIRATVPYAVMGDVTGTDWGTKDAPGREVLLTMSLYDRGENAARLASLATMVQAAIVRVPRQLGAWHVASIVPMRSRLVRGALLGSNSAAGAGTIGPIGAPFIWQSEWRLRVRSI